MADGENGTTGGAMDLDPPAEGATESTYIVQACIPMSENPDAPGGVHWSDIATVVVPPRTKRRGVLAQALESTGMKIGKTALKFRVLDAACSEVIEVREESTTTVVIG